VVDPVVIVDYDPKLARHLPAAPGSAGRHPRTPRGGHRTRRQHRRSRLGRQPIIDLDVVIADRTDLAAVTQRLRPLGYHHEGDLGVAGREAFATPAGAPPHHLYVCALGTSGSTVISPCASPPRRL
jgi:hypothetical protein